MDRVKMNPHRLSFGLAAVSIALAGIAAIAPPLQAQQPSTLAVPERPASLPTANEPTRSGIVDLSETNSPLGIGYIIPSDLDFLEAPEENAAKLEAGWLTDIELPLFATPAGEHWGWLFQGWLVPNGQSALAIGADAAFAMVRTQSALLGFPILESRDDGWLRVQYTETGSAWTHTSYLDLGNLSLTFERWDDLLSNAEQLQFRQAENAQVLRSQPELSRNVITLVRNDSLIEPLEVAGDWVRVRVTRPVEGCQALAGARTEEGWMRWRRNDGGITLWQAAERCG
ncbi:MAG: hypothetical protein F6J97_12070 [Leptolyngbya sp. SIO4C1]|nr:hypothetical protein [Leptolyngbya sp. SIO4C1]